MGKLAALATEDEPATPLQRELEIVGRRLAVISIAAGILVFAIGAARSVAVEALLLTGVALAVAVIPEGLPTIVAVTLARGMERMARWKALVRRLSAVEALGAAAVVCTDKTGTITENRMAVQRMAFEGQTIDVEADTRADSDGRLPAAVDVMRTCNDAFDGGEGLVGDALDVALLRGARLLSPDAPAPANNQRIAEAPFDSDRKRMSVLVDGPDGLVHYMKGAPETVIERCDRALGDADDGDPTDVETLHTAADQMARSGLRTIALARRHIATPPEDLAEAEEGMELVAIVGLADGARAGVRESVADAQRAGIDVVMITGDHQVTAAAIGRDVGIVDDPTEVMPGDRLRAIRQEDLNAEIDRYRAFSRVDPADKVKIVKAWQQRGRVVAMTGDGVNDAPALRAADIGVAMGSGTDIAKDAAGLVLQDDNFSTIINAVREGRKIFSNLRNVVHYLLSSNASEVFTMVIGFGFFGFLGEPLRATQLLWINLVSDGLPALALGVDEPREDVMAQRPGEGRDVLSNRNIALLVAQGVALAFGTILALVAGHYVLDRPWPVTQTMVFTTLVVTQLFHAFNLQRGNGFRIRSALVLAVAISALAQIAVLSLGVTRAAFSVEQLGLVEWAWSVGLAFVGFLGARLARNWFDAHTPRARPAETGSSVA